MGAGWSSESRDRFVGFFHPSHTFKPTRAPTSRLVAVPDRPCCIRRRGDSMMPCAKNLPAPRPPATPWLAAALLGIGLQAMAAGAIMLGATLAATRPRDPPP